MLSSCGYCTNNISLESYNKEETQDDSKLTLKNRNNEKVLSNREIQINTPENKPKEIMPIKKLTAEEDASTKKNTSLNYVQTIRLTLEPSNNKDPKKTLTTYEKSPPEILDNSIENIDSAIKKEIRGSKVSISTASSEENYENSENYCIKNFSEIGTMTDQEIPEPFEDSNLETISAKDNENSEEDKSAPEKEITFHGNFNEFIDIFDAKDNLSNMEDDNEFHNSSDEDEENIELELIPQSKICHGDFTSFSKLDESTAENGNLKNQNNALKEQIENLERSLLNLSEENSKFKSIIRNKHEEVLSQSEFIEKYLKERVIFLEKIENLKRKLDEKEKKLTHAINEESETKKNFEYSLKVLETEKISLEESNKNLNKTVIDLEEERNQNLEINDILENTLTEEKNKNEILEEKNEVLKEKLETINDIIEKLDSSDEKNNLLELARAQHENENFFIDQERFMEIIMRYSSRQDEALDEIKSICITAC